MTIYEALTEMERTNDGGSPSLAPIFVLLGTGCLDLRWKRVFFFLVGERALGGGVGSFALVQDGCIYMELPKGGGPCRLVVKSSRCGLSTCSEKPEVRILPGTSFFSSFSTMEWSIFFSSQDEKEGPPSFGMGLGR